MSSLCELVECWSSEIRSGWRPLFACLRRSPPPAQIVNSHTGLDRSENINSVKEVFAAFLLYGSTNPLLFANAAMDAILCQLHYLKSYRNCFAVSQFHQPVDFRFCLVSALGSILELSCSALEYLCQFSKMLAKLCSSAQTPVFYSAIRLHINDAV